MSSRPRTLPAGFIEPCLPTDAARRQRAEMLAANQKAVSAVCGRCEKVWAGPQERRSVGEVRIQTPPLRLFLWQDAKPRRRGTDALLDDCCNELKTSGGTLSQNNKKPLHFDDNAGRE
jgi:hypothetical protein